MSMKSSPELWHSNVKGSERQVYQQSELRQYDRKAMETNIHIIIEEHDGNTMKDFVSIPHLDMFISRNLE